MKKILCFTILVISFSFTIQAQTSVNSYLQETKQEYDARMAWWKDARFGMFIHWGLYAIPAGQWGGKTDYGEWIRESAQIPVAVYDTFVNYFNPVKFNADEWVKIAKNAGMQYIVITTKHHDGFCLFDSKYTDFDVMSTPFKRDIMKEMSDACRNNGMTMCWYHSIMDWHHPDYLPRRTWEAGSRPQDGADYERYLKYLNNQLTELLTNYGPVGVLWFDGEWESTWNNTYGLEEYNHVRSLQPKIITNNRIGNGRIEIDGLTGGKTQIGDFGTPEQTIPDKGIPGMYWETCMTMNDHWGYNKYDINWKSAEDLLRKLADIASKGGNFLLNVGPTSEGVFPQTSIERLQQIGAWMKTNGESIYGTSASPFEKLSWGRCTQKPVEGGNTRLYLHIFERPSDGILVVPGIYNQPVGAFLLADPEKQLQVKRDGSDLLITLPAALPDPVNTVVALTITGKPDICDPPVIWAAHDIFISTLPVTVTSSRDNIKIHYTIDGSDPAISSPLYSEPLVLKKTTTVKARIFRDDEPVSPVSEQTFTLVKPWPSSAMPKALPGVAFEYFEGKWDSLPDFSKLIPVKTGVIEDITVDPKLKAEEFAYRFHGAIQIPKEGVYTFYTDSDDGSILWIDGKKVVDNDGLHSLLRKEGAVPLKEGLHAITVGYFENSGGNELKVYYSTGDEKPRQIPREWLFY